MARSGPWIPVEKPEWDVDASPVSVVTPEEYTLADEEALRNAKRAIRVGVLSSSALSVGVSQPDHARCVTRARQLGLPVVRRSTGGLGLWHAPGDIVWSLVLPRNDPRVGNDFSKSYRRLGVGPERFLGQLGVPSDWLPPAGLPGEYCLLSGQGAVLTVDGRALGGAAQHLTRDALLHHGVLSYRLEPARLTELFDLPPELVGQRLMSLEPVTDGVSPTELARRLRSALRAEYEAHPG
jgi:lipoate---protein ligase